MIVEFKFAVYDDPNRPKRSTHYRVVSEDGEYWIQQFYASRHEWDEAYTDKDCDGILKYRFDSLKELMDSAEFQWLLTYKMRY